MFKFNFWVTAFAGMTLFAFATFTNLYARGEISKGKLEIVGKGEKKALDDQLIRIGLKIDVEKSVVSCAGSIEVTNLVTTANEKFSAGSYTVTTENGDVYLNGKRAGTSIRMTPLEKDSPLQSNSTKVRGTIKVVVSGSDKVTIINETNLDSYLKGVLPREVISSWPDEALKAQAVASRSYVVANFGKYDSKGFDICADIMCQVYGGLSAEKESTSKAVEDTRGEVMVYKGKPIPAYFHASCGGFTEQIQPVWGSPDRPYLPAKKDPFGSEAPWFAWKLEATFDTILKSLKKDNLVKGEQLKRIEIKKKSRSGRAQTLTVTTEAGSFDMKGNSFRMAMDPGKIRSTLWTHLQRTKSGYLFEGKGWGHGIGLSQWGAKGRAEAGHDYKKILSFYYPETEIVIWDR